MRLEKKVTLCEVKKEEQRPANVPFINLSNVDLQLSAENSARRCDSKDREIEEVRKNKGWMCPHCIEAKGINPHWICNRNLQTATLHDWWMETITLEQPSKLGPDSKIKIHSQVIVNPNTCLRVFEGYRR
ncbi:hypothetical protein JHK85_018547 [Glycine max]|nr:hypothetical protein JHK85_018547 [Glycine max]